LEWCATTCGREVFFLSPIDFAGSLLRLFKQPVSHSRQLVIVIETSHVLHAAFAIKDGACFKADHVGSVSFIKPS